MKKIIFLVLFSAAFFWGTPHSFVEAEVYGDCALQNPSETVECLGGKRWINSACYAEDAVGANPYGSGTAHDSNCTGATSSTISWACSTGRCSAVCPSGQVACVLPGGCVGGFPCDGSTNSVPSNTAATCVNPVTLGNRSSFPWADQTCPAGQSPTGMNPCTGELTCTALVPTYITKYAGGTGTNQDASVIFQDGNGDIGVNTISVSTSTDGSNDSTVNGGLNPLKFDIEGAIGATFYCDEDGNNCVDATTGLGGGTSGASDRIYDLDEDTQVQTEAAADEDFIRFDTDGTERMVINNLGKIGIGTATPLNRLTLVPEGNADMNAFQIMDDTDTNPVSEIGISNNAGILKFMEGATTNIQVSASPSLDTYFNAGNIGIGTTGPVAKLHVKSATDGQLHLERTGFIGWDLELDSAGRFGIGLVTDTNPRVAIQQNGKVIVGDTSAPLPADTYGKVVVIGSEYNGTRDMSMTLSDGIQADAFFYESDKRLKTNIKPITNAIEKIKKIRGVSFDWKKNDRAAIGVIAQEIESVFPEIVNTNGGGYKSVEYGNLVAPLIEAIKEQQIQIENLQNKINQIAE